MKAEYLRRLRALESVGLASESVPSLGVGLFPDPESGWNLVVVDGDDPEGRTHWYVADLGLQMLNEENAAAFEDGVEQIGLIRGSGIPSTSVEGSPVLDRLLAADAHPRVTHIPDAPRVSLHRWSGVPYIPDEFPQSSVRSYTYPDPRTP